MCVFLLPIAIIRFLSIPILPLSVPLFLLLSSTYPGIYRSFFLVCRSLSLFLCLYFHMCSHVCICVTVCDFSTSICSSFSLPLSLSLSLSQDQLLYVYCLPLLLCSSTSMYSLTLSMCAVANLIKTPQLYITTLQS